MRSVWLAFHHSNSDVPTNMYIIISSTPKYVIIVQARNLT